MQIGLVGLDKTDHRSRTRLRDHDIAVTGYDRHPGVSDVVGLAAARNRFGSHGVTKPS